MRIEVNDQICESNGLCAGVAPEVFDLDEDDNLHLLHDSVTPNNEDVVREAVRQCPRNAITLDE
ncbi:ferredoxin [Rhodococcus sp. NPDC058521]|uniref:ferredoxin n=1 Tax=Rhodococcus sp. NPDC058521 TaxID=3346536 RepID=UPI003664A79C